MVIKEITDQLSGKAKSIMIITSVSTEQNNSFAFDWKPSKISHFDQLQSIATSSYSSQQTRFRFVGAASQKTTKTRSNHWRQWTWKKVKLNGQEETVESKRNHKAIKSKKKMSWDREQSQQWKLCVRVCAFTRKNDGNTNTHASAHSANKRKRKSFSELYCDSDDFSVDKIILTIIFFFFSSLILRHR